jgi:hypothetical protein
MNRRSGKVAQPEASVSARLQRAGFSGRDSAGGKWRQRRRPSSHHSVHSQNDTQLRASACDQRARANADGRVRERGPPSRGWSRHAPPRPYHHNSGCGSTGREKVCGQGRERAGAGRTGAGERPPDLPALLDTTGRTMAVSLSTPRSLRRAEVWKRDGHVAGVMRLALTGHAHSAPPHNPNTTRARPITHTTRMLRCMHRAATTHTGTHAPKHTAALKQRAREFCLPFPLPPPTSVRGPAPARLADAAVAAAPQGLARSTHPPPPHLAGLGQCTQSRLRTAEGTQRERGLHWGRMRAEPAETVSSSRLAAGRVPRFTGERVCLHVYTRSQKGTGGGREGTAGYTRRRKTTRHSTAQHSREEHDTARRTELRRAEQSTTCGAAQRGTHQEG